MVLTLIISNPRNYNRRDLNRKKLEKILDSENFNIFNMGGFNLRRPLNHSEMNKNGDGSWWWTPPEVSPPAPPFPIHLH